MTPKAPTPNVGPGLIRDRFGESRSLHLGSNLSQSRGKQRQVNLVATRPPLVCSCLPTLAGGTAAAVRQCGSAGSQLASYGTPAGGTEIAHSLQSRCRKKCSVCETDRLGIKKLGGVHQTPGKFFHLFHFWIPNLDLSGPNNP